MYKAKSLSISVSPFEIVAVAPVEISHDGSSLICCLLKVTDIFIKKSYPLAVMNSTVRSRIIAACHAIFCDEDVLVISLIEELRSPVQARRSYRPSHCCLVIASVSFFIYYLALISGLDRISVVDILTYKVYGLIYKLHVFLGYLEEVIFEQIYAFLRISSKDHGIQEP